MSLCQACSGLCFKNFHDIIQVAEIRKIIYQEAEEIMKSSIHETNIGNARQCRLQLIAQSLEVVLESFDVALEGWRTHNPNAGFANALWHSLSKIKVYDRERKVSEHRQGCKIIIAI
jgi:hypothetical protein